MDDEMISIGQGGFGSVFLLKKYNPPIVLKEIELIKGHPQAELLILKELVHPNIVRYLDQPFDFTYQGRDYPIFMEYCEEGTLRKAIGDVTLNYSVATIVQWSIELFTVLVYLKSKGIAHRDIKPENLFLTSAFLLKVGDFGIIERFQKEDTSTDEFQFAGTALYMAPEIKFGKLKLDSEDLFKCDVFAAGLVVWELIERRSLFTVSKPIVFTPTTCKNVVQLQDLVVRCSSPDINIKLREDADGALKKLKSLEKLFTSFLAQPVRNLQQKSLNPPEGLCLVDHEKFTVPNVTFDTLNDKKMTGPLVEPDKISRQLQMFVQDWIPKFERKSDFSRLMIKKEAHENMFEFNTMKFGSEDDENLCDLNELRKSICDKVLGQANFENLNIEQKRELVSEMQDFFIYLSKKHSPEDFFHHIQFIVHYIDEYFKKKKNLSENLISTLQVFKHLASFDFHLQDFCVRFAFHILWNCDSLTLSWVELLDLLEAAIHNIEEVEKIFTRRLRFDLFFLKNSRTEWGRGYDLVFRRDLSEIRLYTEVEKGIFKPDDLVQVIDIETVRRALYDRHNTVQRYSVIGERKTTDLAVSLQNFLHLANQKVRNYRTARLSHFPKDYLEYLPASADELIKKANALKDRAKIHGDIYFLDSITGSPKCECSTHYDQAEFEFPEKAPHEKMKMKISSCCNVDMLEFLTAHSLFDRAFRLLHQWENIELYIHTYSYLLEEILKGMKDKQDPEIGFFFMFMKEKAWPGNQIGETRSPKRCDHEGGEGNREREGLLIGLNAPHTNAFWSKDFKFESACHDCFLEYVGLIFISLYELCDLLKIMNDFLSTSKKASITDKNQKRRERYRDEMRAAIEKFWSNKEMLN